MRLSEAMILGSTMIRHVDRPASGIDEGCALQCADIATGPYRGFQALVEENPFLSQRCPCPACGESATGFAVVAKHLNDTHKWSIDRIAEWVASIEPAEGTELSNTPSLATETREAANIEMWIETK